MAGDRCGGPSSYFEDDVVELVREGAEGLGYLLKDRIGDLGVFADAVHRVEYPRLLLDPEVVRQDMV